MVLNWKNKPKQANIQLLEFGGVNTAEQFEIVKIYCAKEGRLLMVSLQPELISLRLFLLLTNKRTS